MKVTILPLEPQASALDWHRAQEACGLPLFWAVDWEGIGSLKEHLEASYGSPMPAMVGGSIAADGVYTPPQDPDLQPLAKVEFEKVTFYQYDYGLVAIVSPDGTYITRMD